VTITGPQDIPLSLVAPCNGTAATSSSNALGYVAIVWESNYAGFRSRSIPLVHQDAVGESWRRCGVATLLMDAAERVSMDHDLIWLTKDLVS
jgi:hypothetical protein